MLGHNNEFQTFVQGMKNSKASIKSKKTPVTARNVETGSMDGDEDESSFVSTRFVNYKKNAKKVLSIITVIMVLARSSVEQSGSCTHH